MKNANQNPTNLHLALAVVLTSLVAATYVANANAEIVTLDNFKCNPQRAALSMPTKPQSVTTDYAATACTTYNINSLSVKRQLSLTAFNNSLNYLTQRNVAWGMSPQNVGAVPQLGDTAGSCTVRYTFDTQTLAAGSSIKLVTFNQGQTGQATIQLYNGALVSKYSLQRGSNTLTFPISEFNLAYGRPIAPVSSLASFVISTNCMDGLFSVTLDKR